MKKLLDISSQPAYLTIIALLLIITGMACDPPTPTVEPTPTVDNSKMSRIAFVSKRDGDWEIYLMNADGTDQRNITNNPAFDSQPSRSPDGSQIVFFSDRDGDREIYIMNSDGSDVTQLTSNSGSDHMPALSHDGNKIAFVSDRDGRLNLWVMDTDGSSSQNITPKKVNTRWPAWSPDDKSVIFEHKANIFSVNIDDLSQNRIVRNRTDMVGYFVGWPSGAPDGHRIALTIRFGMKGRPPTLYTMASGGEDIQPLQRKPSNRKEERPSYSPDGNFLSYSSLETGVEPDVYVVEISTNKRIRLTDNPALDGFPVWEPKGYVPEYPQQPTD